jgi:ATP synthase protein I
MIAFFVLGAAAGMMNVFRAVAGLGHQVGYRPAPPKADADRDDRNGGRRSGDGKKPG